MTKAAERVRSFLTENGITFTTTHHRPAYTAQETAATEHIPGRSFAKPVILIADGHPVMTVLTADSRVDLDKAGDAIGASEVRLATEAEFAPLCPDCERGAEPPFGNLYDMPVYLDTRFDSDVMYFAAGNHGETIRMETGDYLRLVQPQRADLAFEG